MPHAWPTFSRAAALRRVGLRDSLSETRRKVHENCTEPHACYVAPIDAWSNPRMYLIIASRGTSIEAFRSLLRWASRFRAAS